MMDVTHNAVKYATLLLLERYGKATTLDVKLMLRGEDWFAEQHTISVLLMEVADECSLVAVDGDRYRTYSLPTPDDLATTPAAPVTLSISQSPLVPTYSDVTYTKRDGTITCGQFARPALETDVWVVSSPLDTTPVLWFSTTNSRDDVRQAYAHTYDIPFHRVRSSKGA